MTEHATTTTTAEGPVPCFVRHEDAGGQCYRSAAMRVHGLSFCAEHGEEARLGANMEMHQDAADFFERLRNPHMPSINDLVDRELEHIQCSLLDECPSQQEYDQALMRAYPNPPAEVRERIRNSILAEEGGRGAVEDFLLSSLYHLHKLLRLTRVEGETWLVEMLEEKRQGVAAEAACALAEEDDLAE